MRTIKTVLAQSANILKYHSDSPLLDAEVLLAWVLQKTRSYLRAWCDNELTLEQLIHFEQLLIKRQQGIPIAYLIGQREFWSRDFKVSPEVLIPRPDTEVLIELCLQLIPQNQAYRLLDLGTGSGIIAITLAAERPLIQVTAVDYSESALEIAKQNALAHAINTIDFYQSDWFASIKEQQFDIIVSNPPYIASDDAHLLQGDVRFEPKTALVAGDEGLSDIKIITKTAKHYLKNQGYLLIEHGYNQETAVQAIFLANNYVDIKTERDLSGQSRVTMGRYN